MHRDCLYAETKLQHTLVEAIIMNSPILIESDSFQDVWQQAVFQLNKNDWELWDIVVRINKPLEINQTKHKSVTDFGSSAEKLIIYKNAFLSET